MGTGIDDGGRTENGLGKLGVFTSVTFDRPRNKETLMRERKEVVKTILSIRMIPVRRGSDCDCDRLGIMVMMMIMGIEWAGIRQRYLVRGVIERKSE